jgi:hypothetical protein
MILGIILIFLSSRKQRSQVCSSVLCTMKTSYMDLESVRACPKLLACGRQESRSWSCSANNIASCKLNLFILCCPWFDALCGENVLPGLHILYLDLPDVICINSEDPLVKWSWVVNKEIAVDPPPKSYYLRKRSQLAYDLVEHKAYSLRMRMGRYLPIWS